MKIVWVSNFFSNEFLSVLFFCAALIIISLIIFLKTHSSYIFIVRFVCVLVFVFNVLFMTSSIYDSIKEWNFMQDNQRLIEGEIENFSTGQTGSESFYVGEEYFCYPSYDNGLYAYDIPKRNGNSVIIGEGQFVRLTYYKFNGVNNICKIEVRKTGDSSPEGTREDGGKVLLPPF